tara:strand:+ start:306 stop:575 length:270 start_codon:yes stop_codon:yes gene_type:complete
MRKSQTKLYCFCLDGYEVHKFTDILEDFLIVFNSNESLSSDFQNTYAFLTARERDWNAEIWEQRMSIKALADAEEYIKTSKEFLDEVRL